MEYALVGGCTIRIQLTHSYQAPGDPTLVPIKLNLVSKFAFKFQRVPLRAAARGEDRPVQGGAEHTSNPVDPQLETAWFQPLSLSK
jgi:hypothetical protein